MKRLWHYLSQAKWYFIISIIAMLITVTLDMFNPYLLGRIIDRVIVARETKLFPTYLIYLAVITISRALLGFIKEYLADYGSQKVIAKLRRDLFEHLQGLSFEFFDRMNTGELMSRLKEDLDNIWRAISFGMIILTEQILSFMISAVLLFTLDWRLAIFTLALMPLIAYVTFKLEKQIGEVYEKLSDQGVVLNTTAQENLAGVRLVKAFGREKYEIEKFLSQNQANYNLNMEHARVWGKHLPRLEFLTNVVIVMVTTIGGWFVIRGDLSLGKLVAFSNYIMMMIWPIRISGWLMGIVAQAQASAKKVTALFDEQPKITEVEAPITLNQCAGRITFENVSFQYQETSVLKEINLDLKPGQTLAIMGMTGSGKTSLINLITRFYDATSGRILLDGVEIRKLALKDLRSQIALVMQDTFLFSDTIAENIKFGAESSPTAITQAAQIANIHKFITTLKDQYETVIGERGLGLSGGQKQRLTIARALVKNAKILILDDATSNLDLETEFQIQKALASQTKITKIIIAHRISAVKDADEIIILENGAIVERGRHQELLNLRGYYYQTYQAQFQGVPELHQEVKTYAN